MQRVKNIYNVWFLKELIKKVKLILIFGDALVQKKPHTNPVWKLPLWVQFPDFCDSKIGWQEAGVSVQDIFYHLEYTQWKTLWKKTEWFCVIFRKWTTGKFCTSLAARSSWTTAELTVVGMVWILSTKAFSRSRTPWKHTHTHATWEQIWGWEISNSII